MLLTGHLSEYPLPVLLEIFLQKKETGKLEVACPTASGYFYFRGGELMDAAMGSLRGLDAVNFAENLPEATFNFSRLGPAEYAQSVWSQSFAQNRGSVAKALPSSAKRWRQLPFYTEAATGLVRMAAGKTASASSSLPQLLAHLRIPGWGATAFLKSGELRTHLGKTFERLEGGLKILASEFNQARFGYRRVVVVAGALLLISVSTALVVSNRPAKYYESPSPALAPPSSTGDLSEAVGPALTSTGAEKNRHAETRRRADAQGDNSKRNIETAQKSKSSPLRPVNSIPKKTEAFAAGTQTVAVTLRIENGRVSRASVLNHRPGMEAFEASALRIARSRRYDPREKRSETVVLVKVNQPQ